MRGPIAYFTDEPETVSDFHEALQTDGVAYLTIVRRVPNGKDLIDVLFVMDHESNTLIVCMPKCCAHLKRDTPFNQFELVKGRFTLDIAQRIIVYLSLPQEGKSRALQDRPTQALIGHIKETTDGE